MAAKPDDKSSDIPDRLYDANQRKTYKRMRFFGKVSAAAVSVKNNFLWRPRMRLCGLNERTFLSPLCPFVLLLLLLLEEHVCVCVRENEGTQENADSCFFLLLSFGATC